MTSRPSHRLQALSRDEVLRTRSDGFELSGRFRLINRTSLRIALQRSALVAQAVILLVFGIVLLLHAFQPQCVGISAVRLGQGGLVCETFVDRGGLLFLGAALIVAMVALMDVGAARRPESRVALGALVLQAPLVAVEAFAVASWYQARAASWILYGLIAFVTSLIIAIASPPLVTP